MKKLVSIYDLMIEHFEELHAGEELLLIEFPFLVQRISNVKLRQLLNEYYNRTRSRIDRLERIVDLLELESGTTDCPVIEAFLHSARMKMNKTQEHVVKDSELAVSVQSINQFKATIYSALAMYADFLEMDEVAPILRVTLNEEKENYTRLGTLIQQLLTSGVHPEDRANPLMNL